MVERQPSKLHTRVRFSLPAHFFIAPLVKWYNVGFVIRDWQFDSVKGHQTRVIGRVVKCSCLLNKCSEMGAQVRILYHPPNFFCLVRIMDNTGDFYSLNVGSIPARGAIYFFEFLLYNIICEGPKAK